MLPLFASRTVTTRFVNPVVFTRGTAMAMPIQIDLHRSFPRKFVPSDADMGNWADIEPLFTELLNRKVASVDELERWLLDYSELLGSLWEESNLRYIAMTSQTDDTARERAYQHLVEEITPRCKPLIDAIERAYLENPTHAGLPKERYEVLDRKTNAHVALYREKNVDLETREELLSKDYFKVMGAIMIPVDGKDLTPEQASKFLEEPDRAIRQRVWERIAAERLKHKEELEAIFDKL